MGVRHIRRRAAGTRKETMTWPTAEPHAQRLAPDARRLPALYWPRRTGRRPSAERTEST